MKLQRLLVLPLLFLISCGSQEIESTNSNREAIAACPERLTLAVTDIFGEEELKKDFGEFQTILGEALGISIDLFPMNDRVTAVPALLFERIDLALAGPSEYVLLKANADAIPLVGITRPGYYTVIVANANSGIENLQQLKGKTIGIREEGSTASHLGALKILADMGLKPNQDFNVEIIGSDRGLVVLKEGKLDVWSDGNHHYQRALEKYNLQASEFTRISQGKPLPNDLIVANPSLNAECIAQLQARIVENERKLIDAIGVSPANKKYAQSQIVPAKDEDYDLIREGYKAIGEEDLLSPNQ
ncbi:MAG: PhnD/SsuA/transferrin family substrate-binding protein [Roseofilum sp. Belize BBD 4]|uniref:PhnD/SsuA/transferrin family substrate-binding protein n=1 Tax=Roseofilum sp. Belize BBD 4 TaxID=2821500 RepID=UPI000E94A126|nr:PhnD/SsuA/transferrin family substrate-binding protein [Roseofilum sp. Belize BBD 4]MBP0033953.1 PhnD/SsuA/transferrin family substrate-binding protein [Roseofilum sp. Belize BBD 4]HBQ97925.1 phosphonate ABC transporter substrate-binding protein [Cyanobacteria bacterium UBA11691]